MDGCLTINMNDSTIFQYGYRSCYDMILFDVNAPYPSSGQTLRSAQFARIVHTRPTDIHHIHCFGPLKLKNL